MKKKKRKIDKNWLPKLTKEKAKKTGKGLAFDTGATLVGTGVGAVLGKWGLAAGGLLLLAGNYVQKDIKQYFRIAGASAVAWGVASAFKDEEIENDAAVNGVGFVAMKEGAKNRLLNLKNSWIKALRIDKLTKSNSGESSNSSIGSIDLSALDTFEDSVKRSAVEYQMSQMDDEDDFEDYEDHENQLIESSNQDDEFDLVNGIYAEEEFDLSTI